MNRCEDCGTILEGGYCPNCDEELFIANQYTELKMDIPPIIAKRASEAKYRLMREELKKAVNIF